jgi:hypothetical protein
VRYIAVAHKPFTVESGMVHELSFEQTEIVPVENAKISGVVITPAEHPLFRRELSMQWMGSRIRLEGEWDPEAEFTYTVPVVAGATFAIASHAMKPDGLSSFGGAYTFEWVEGLEPGQSGLTITLQDPPELVTPPDEYSPADHSTEFFWRGSGRGIYVMTALSTWRFGVRFEIITNQPIARIPTTDIFGLSPFGQGFYWYVREMEDYPSVNALLQRERPTTPSSLLSGRRRFGFATEP